MSLVFKNTAFILLAVFLLLSSIGVSINKMICLSGNKTTYSLLEKKSCFPIDEDEKKTDSDTFDARCCDFVSGYVHVDLLSFEDPLKLKVSQILIVFGFAKQFPFELINPVLTQGYTETPPLAYGITLLKFIGIFRI